MEASLFGPDTLTTDKKLIFNERIRFMPEKFLWILFGWYYKGFFKTCVDMATVEEVLYNQVFGERAERKPKHLIHSAKRRGHLVKVDWGRNDRLTDDCLIYRCTSVHRLRDDNEL